MVVPSTGPKSLTFNSEYDGSVLGSIYSGSSVDVPHRSNGISFTRDEQVTSLLYRVEDLTNKLEESKKRLAESQERYRHLRVENGKVTADLEEERKRSRMLEDKANEAIKVQGDATRALQEATSNPGTKADTEGAYKRGFDSASRAFAYSLLSGTPGSAVAEARELRAHFDVG